MESYIYICVDKKTLDVKYVGKGTGDRYKHILSGTSSSYSANRDYHNGIASDCAVYHLAWSPDNSFLESLEMALIYTLQPKWNTNYIDDMPEVDYIYMDISDRILTALEFLKISNNDTIEDIYMNMLRVLCVDRESVLSVAGAAMWENLVNYTKWLDERYCEYWEADEDWSKVEWIDCPLKFK